MDILAQRCAFLFAQLKKVNDIIDRFERDMEQSHLRPRLRNTEIPRATLQHLFQEDVRTARDHVSEVSRQFMFDLMRDITTVGKTTNPLMMTTQQQQQQQPQQLATASGTSSGVTVATSNPMTTLSLHEKYDSFHKRIERKVTDCIAFLYHLRTCVHTSPSLSDNDISLTLGAATMALKSDSQESSSNALYQEIQSYIQILTQCLLPPQSPPSPSSSSTTPPNQPSTPSKQ